MLPSSPRFRAAVVVMACLAVELSGCGGDGAPARTSSPNGGAAGARSGGAGGTGATAGSAGNGGGGAGQGGATGGGAGLGGNPGGGAGLGGAAGGKKPGEPCSADAACTSLGVETEPPACAEAYCKAGLCALRAKDGDGDGFRMRTCKLISDGAFVVELGGDCDDTNPEVSPKSWDGPAADGKPNRCADGIDQDCSGADGDGIAPSGASCACVPGDVGTCAQTASGAPIAFPGGVPAKGSICKLGSRTCVKGPTGGGTWGPCVDAVPPSLEICNTLDDDCDGLVDEADAQGKTEWVYDGDDDGYRATRSVPNAASVPFAARSSCTMPNEVPTECDAAYCGSTPSNVCCPPDKWRAAGTAKGLDCDDADPQVKPGAAEECATPTRDKDENCDGQKNELPAVGAALYYLDEDDDGFGDRNTKPVTSCLPPGPKWKTGLLNSDCDDARASTRPGIAEDCATAEDDNCSGSARDGCNCLPSDPQEIDCGVPSDCGYVAKGSQCVGGAYTACPPLVGREEYCADLDGDGFCLFASCALYCKTVTPDSTGELRPAKYLPKDVCDAKAGDCDDTSKVISPVGIETCNDADDDCNGTVDDVIGLGDACNVTPQGTGSPTAGACLGGGKLACTGSGQPLACVSTQAGIGVPFTPPASSGANALEGWFTQNAPNGSADWDCNGKVELWAAAENTPFPLEVRPTCGLTPAQICATAKDEPTCRGPGYSQTLAYAEAGANVPGCACPPDTCDVPAQRRFTCGGAFIQFACGWNGSTCIVLGSAGPVLAPPPGCSQCSPSSAIQRCH